jgi:CBS-domain-containing membrane protein
MVRLDVTHLPVVDARGGLLGMVTRRDLLKVFLRSDPAVRWEVDYEVVRSKFGIAAGEVRSRSATGWWACVAGWSAAVMLRRRSGACRRWMG